MLERIVGLIEALLTGLVGLLEAVMSGNKTAIVVAAVLAAAGYAFACVFWPWTSCRKCEGKGRFRSPSGKNWRKCPRCKGASSKVRLGRRIWDRLAAKR